MLILPSRNRWRFTGVSGSLAAGNCRLDMTDTNAFAWFNGFDLTAYQDGSHLLWMKDANGKVAWGFIKSGAPAGETLGDELVTNGDMELDSNWVDEGGMVSNRDRANGLDTGPDIGGAHTGTYCRYTITTVDARYIESTAFSLTTGKLYKLSFWHYSNDANIDYAVLDGNGSTLRRSWPVGVAAWTNLAYYLISLVTGVKGKLGLSADHNAPKYAYFDDASFKQVTDPPSTACHIVSAKGGATRAYANIESGFNPNTAVAYKIYKV